MIHMEIHTVESDLLELESKIFANKGERIDNTKIVPKKGTHRALRINHPVLSHKSESPLNIFYNLQKDHIIY